MFLCVRRHCAGIIGFLLVAAVLPGCATQTNTGYSSLHRGGIRADYLLPKPDGGRSEITIIRERTFAGSALYLWIVLDGEVVAAIGNGERLTLQANPGFHLLGTDATGTVGGEMKADSRNFFLITIDNYQLRFMLQRITSDDASLWRNVTNDVSEVGIDVKSLPRTQPPKKR